MTVFGLSRELLCSTQHIPLERQARRPSAGALREAGSIPPMPENDPGMSFRIKWQGDRGATTHQDLARSRSRGAESAPGSCGHAVLSACRMEPGRYRRGSKAGMFLYFKRMACEGHIAHQDSSEAAAMKALGGGSSRANLLARWLAEGGSRCHRRSRPLSSSFTDPFADSP